MEKDEFSAHETALSILVCSNFPTTTTYTFFGLSGDCCNKIVRNDSIYIQQTKKNKEKPPQTTRLQRPSCLHYFWLFFSLYFKSRKIYTEKMRRIPFTHLPYTHRSARHFVFYGRINEAKRKKKKETSWREKLSPFLYINHTIEPKVKQIFTWKTVEENFRRPLLPLSFPRR